ncbi:MAG: hypothetical protein JKY82_12185 [Rhizobiaceae bacterium]|nr:hypothetical protein [Rhizobiaceae bacterium]
MVFEVLFFLVFFFFAGVFLTEAFLVFGFLALSTLSSAVWESDFLAVFFLAEGFLAALVFLAVVFFSGAFFAAAFFFVVLVDALVEPPPGLLRQKAFTFAPSERENARTHEQLLSREQAEFDFPLHSAASAPVENINVPSSKLAINIKLRKSAFT